MEEHLVVLEHCYYIGIDIDDKNAVVSVYQSGMKEPDTISMVAGSEVFQIPLLLTKKKGIGQWFIGEEAGKIALKQEGELVEEFLTKALKQEVVWIEGESYQARELLVLYIKKLFNVAGRFSNPGLPDKVVIAVEKLSKEMTELFFFVGEQLGLERSRVTLIDRKESFYYFALNQKPELWLHDVFLFDYRGENIACCHMKRNEKTVPQVITLETEVRRMEDNSKDESFYKILQDCFHGNIVSSVYLVGDGFEGNWMKLSLSFMCRGRRAFIGKNLYSKGACYAAMVLDEQLVWPYVYIGDNEMKVNVSLKVKNKGTMEFLTLISAGENWYEAGKECEVILDGTPEINFWLQLPNSREARIEKLELSDLPERANKTTRLRIRVTPISDESVKIQIRDMGFGEIAKSSEKTWEYVMTL